MVPLLHVSPKAPSGNSSPRPVTLRGSAAARLHEAPWRAGSGVQWDAGSGAQWDTSLGAQWDASPAAQWDAGFLPSAPDNPQGFAYGPVQGGYYSQPPPPPPPRYSRLQQWSWPDPANRAGPHEAGAALGFIPMPIPVGKCSPSSRPYWRPYVRTMPMAAAAAPSGELNGFPAAHNMQSQFKRPRVE